MLISHFVEGVRADLANLGRLGDEQIQDAAHRLGEAAGPVLRTRLLEALDLLVAEANVEGDRHDWGLTLAGDEVSLSRAPADPEPGDVPGDFTARFALRLPEEVKAHVEQLAQQAGTSANAWIVRALARETAVGTTQHAQRASRQLRGTGRS